ACSSGSLPDCPGTFDNMSLRHLANYPIASVECPDHESEPMSTLFDRDRAAERLPVSLITGFLGSGKTTLLNHLVQRPEMADSAVIINEFGETPLDHLLVAPVTGEAVVLASGCVCCAVRGDLQDSLLRLLIERDNG